MKGYNLYYKNECINNAPLSVEDLHELFTVNKNEYIYKHNVILKKIKEIDKKKIKIVECTIV